MKFPFNFYPLVLSFTVHCCLDPLLHKELQNSDFNSLVTYEFFPLERTLPLYQSGDSHMKGKKTFDSFPFFLEWVGVRTTFKG